MLATRAIPCLLVRRRGLYKTVQFTAPKYVGDPINAVRIFNDKEVDELVVLDIGAADAGGPDFELLADLTTECFMPLAYGGGIRSMDHVRRLFALGMEKVVLNTATVDSPALVQEAAATYGNQSVVASIDVRKERFRGYRVFTRGGSSNTGLDPVEHARAVERLGAGEIFLTSVDREGTGKGFDLELVRRVVDAVEVPVVAHGGAGELSHLAEAVRDGGAHAVAAGSLFVFKGRHRAVLISYPSYDELTALFS